MRKNETQIPEDVIDVFRTAIVEDGIVRFPGFAPNYARVKDVMGRLGGVWHKGKKGHIFEGDADPAGLLAEAIETRVMPAKNELAYYATPEHIVDQMLLSCRPLEPGLTYLEPSAGEGAIALQLRDAGVPNENIFCVEYDAGRCATLDRLGFQAIHADFMNWDAPVKFDRILMNPPFAVPGSRYAYAEHMWRAYDMLNDGGVLVAIAPLGLEFSTVKRVAELRDLIERNGDMERLPDGTFVVSGTAVSTVMVVVVK